MLIVPVQAVPNQIVTSILGGQTCQINLKQRRTGLFMTLYKSNTLVIAGVLCHNLNRIVRSAYLGFTGDFMFIDNAGQSDPIYTGLGKRFSLAYLEAADLG